MPADDRPVPYAPEVRGWLQEYEEKYGKRGSSRLTTEQVPLDWTCGEARVIDARSLVGSTKPAAWPASPEITVQQVEAYEREAGQLRAGDVVIFQTGYNDRHLRPDPASAGLWQDPLAGKSEGWPAPGPDLIVYLQSKGIRCVTSDAPDLGGVDPRRALMTYWTLASREMVGVEFLINVDKIPSQGAYFLFAAVKVRDKALRLAADLLEVAPHDLDIRDGMVFVKGLPDRRLALGALATVANPIRYAYGKEAAEAALRLVKPRHGAVLRDGEEPGLEARGYYAPPQATFASGCHAAVVEVDVETGVVRVLRYVVQHDCGRIVNPTIVDGQIHGGVAQGIGGALYERLCFDDAGQPLTPTFMQFHIPTASEVPSIDVVHLETLSPLNPLGVKGVGEAGAIPVPAVVAEAVEDALAPFGVRVSEMPLSPERIVELIRTARSTRR